MKILKIILISAVSLLISLLLFGWFIGFFKNMKVKEKEEGGFDNKLMSYLNLLLKINFVKNKAYFLWTVLKT